MTETSDDMSPLLSFIQIDGIAFDPFIRGWLVVLTGVFVLMGSVYLLLATNSGARTGLLIALTGFFGWMVIMGLIWWLYGIGLTGDEPAWDIVEVNRGDLTAAQLAEAQELGVALEAEEEATGLDVEELGALSEETGERLEIGGWSEMLVADPARGEAQATVDAFLVGSAEFETAQEYLPLAAFEIGGKDQPASESIVDGALNKLQSIFVQPRNPPHYAVVLVQPVEERTLNARPGLAPPVRQVDASQPILSVIMVRDLGSVRLPPAMITLGSLVLFAIFAWMLHTRDKREAANRASLVPIFGSGSDAAGG